MSRRATLPQPDKRTDLERAALTRMKQGGIPTPVAEYQGIPGRKFRFDFAWPEQRVAFEAEGGAWDKGPSGHTSGVHFRKDCEKYSLAAANGWLVIRATTDQIHSGEFIPWLRQALERTAP